MFGLYSVKNVKIPIEDGKTIEELESYAQGTFGVGSLKFFTYDGAEIAKQTTAETFSSLP
jgi:hypothetical protein